LKRLPYIKAQFLLDPDVHFLNHGSFGACPRPVFDVYQNWQRELERQPVEFMGRRYHGLMNDSREHLAQYINAAPEDLIYVPNATYGMNIVARSLDLQPGDEILSTDHEYGAINHLWTFICEKTGAKLISQPITLPIVSDEQVLEQLWAGVSPRTKVISISHITSPTAVTFPVEAICKRARDAGILIVVDGAHAPGQLDLDMEAIGADFYTGNCHKWMCAPKGAGFLWVRRDHHAMIDPLVISWGWQPDSTLVSHNQWQGTQDIAAYLSVPAAIEFMQQHDWHEVRQHCHQLALETRQRIIELSGKPTLIHKDGFVQMFAAELPQTDAESLKTTLLNDYHVEVPFLTWGSRTMVRVSVQAYNIQTDLDALVQGLRSVYTGQ